MELINKYVLNVKDYYFEPHRKFHSWNHIESGLHLFEKASLSTLDQKIAWLYHDIFYVPGANNNESLSAMKAKEDISINHDSQFLDSEIISIIINDTKLHIPTIEESKLVLDIDMSCLALEDYNEFFYQRVLAAKEYISYGKENIIIGTKKFIKDTLSLKQIFHSNDFFYMNNLAINNLERFYNEFEKDPRFTSIFKSDIKLKI